MTEMNKLMMILLMLPLLAYGQIPADETNIGFTDKVSEKVVCFTDRNLYLSGDEIWFSAFIAVNGSSELLTPGKVLYAELFDRREKVVSSAKYRIDSNRCEGQFSIPPETLSGAYFIRFYTKYQRNFHPSTFEVIPVTIVNTGLTLPSSKGQKILAPAEQPSSELNVITQQSTYRTREQVSFTIAPPEAFEGWLNISVARKGTINSIIREWHTPTTSDSDSLFYVPDIRGVSLSGYVKDKKNPMASADLPVYLSAFGDNHFIHITRTKSNGAFLFSLNELYGVSDVFVTIDPKQEGDKQMLINTGFSNRFGEIPSHGFHIDSTYYDLLSAMVVDLETRKAFERTLESTGRASLNNLPVTYDFSIRLDDYIELASLSEVIYEIVPPVSVRNKSGLKYLAVANYQTQQVASAGLVLLDNVPVFNVDELLKIPPVNIERIDVINRPYYLGDHLLGSIVSLKTKTGDFGGYKFPVQSIFLEYQAYEQEKVFSAPDYADPNDDGSSVPDFRTTLYWEPARETGTASKVSFYCSDARGEYEIRVRGLSKRGTILSGKATITVE